MNNIRKNILICKILIIFLLIGIFGTLTACSNDEPERDIIFVTLPETKPEALPTEPETEVSDREEPEIYETEMNGINIKLIGGEYVWAIREIAWDGNVISYEYECEYEREIGSTRLKFKYFGNRISRTVNGVTTEYEYGENKSGYGAGYSYGYGRAEHHPLIHEQSEGKNIEYLYDLMEFEKEDYTVLYDMVSGFIYNGVTYEYREEGPCGYITCDGEEIAKYTITEEGKMVVENYTEDNIGYIFSRPFNTSCEYETMLRFMEGLYPMTVTGFSLTDNDAEIMARNILEYIYGYLYDGEGSPLHRPQWYR